MKLCAYPIPTKGKSVELCSAFVKGRGTVAHDGRLRPDTVAVFYGVDASNARTWAAVRAAGLPFVYLDNSYFDASRGTYFRATASALQHEGDGESDGKRFEALRVRIQPWRAKGRHVVLCPQSPIFMRFVSRYRGDWLVDALQRLQGCGLPARVRKWSADKPKALQSLQADLVGAHAVVTHSSCAAVEAVLAGVPVVVSDDSAAACFGSSTLGHLQRPDEDERRRWASVLADNQFTVDELRSGFAWGRIRSGQVLV